MFLLLYLSDTLLYGAMFCMQSDECSLLLRLNVLCNNIQNLYCKPVYFNPR